jgi:hypothetical protein
MSPAPQFEKRLAARNSVTLAPSAIPKQAARGALPHVLSDRTPGHGSIACLSIAERGTSRFCGLVNSQEQLVRRPGALEKIGPRELVDFALSDEIVVGGPIV